MSVKSDLDNAAYNFANLGGSKGAMYWDDYISAIDAYINDQFSQKQTQLVAERDKFKDELLSQQSDAQNQINQGAQQLARQVTNFSESTLANQLQPIVINAEQKTPWLLLLASGVLVYIIFGKGK